MVAAVKTRQQQVPGTEVGSKELRAYAERVALGRQNAKVHQDSANVATKELEPLMAREGVSELVVEVAVGEKLRKCKVTRTEKTTTTSKIETELIPDEDE